MRRFVAAGLACAICAVSAWLLSGLGGATVRAAEIPGRPPDGLITNLVQLRNWADQNPSVVHPCRIVAEVCDMDCADGVLVLQDASGAEFIRLNHVDRGIEPGETVRLEGDGCSPRPESFGLSMLSAVVVENDGIHAVKTESGTALLHAGITPFCVEWFNAGGEVALGLEYEGPGLPRQPVPASAFRRANIDPATGKTNFSAGLDYRCYEGAWEYLSDFGRLQMVKTGVATNLDLDVRTRKENVGLRFTGFITIPRDGIYQFYLSSDDGSRLFVGRPSVTLTVLSKAPEAFSGGGQRRHLLKPHGTAGN